MSAPILEISDVHGALVWYAPFKVLALLARPDDEERREALFESLAASVMLESGPVPERARRAVVKRAMRIELAMGDAASAGYGTAVAGELLLWILSAASYDPRNASIRKAIAAWQRAYCDARDESGHRLATSERTVKAAWSRWKPLAPMCAALQLHRDAGAESPLDPTSNDTLVNFLAVAEAVRLAAERHHPPIGRTGSKAGPEPLLDPERTWRPPSDLVLPTALLGVPRPTMETAAWLANYKSHESEG